MTLWQHWLNCLLVAASKACHIVISQVYPLAFVEMMPCVSSSVAPSAVNMTEMSQGDVDEGTSATFTCETDSSNPDADIEWTLPGHEFTGVTTTQHAGDWEANYIISEATLQTTREMNKQTVTCHVQYKT